MKVLIAPCSYKGTIGCAQIASAMACGLKLGNPTANVDMCPIADGGDGTLDALHTAVGGRVQMTTVEGPLSQSVQAPWLKLGRLAVVELASASGLALLEGHFSPIDAHTKGLGQLIAAASADVDVDNIVVCLGGSASTEGGSGLLTALGAKFCKSDGSAIKLGASEIKQIVKCNLQAIRLRSHQTVSVAVDVRNPLLGVDGAAFTYAPQKGATEAMVVELDSALAHYADILEATTGRHIRNQPGAGAAGGTAFGIACVLGSEIISGFDWIASLIQLESRVKQADVIVTGEGRLDGQTLSGKAIGQLATLCKQYNKELYVLPASCTNEHNWLSLGVTKVVPVVSEGEVATVNDVVKITRAVFKNLKA